MTAIKRLDAARTAIAKLGKMMEMHIGDEFHALRIEEVELTADFLMKKEEEREAARAERERDQLSEQQVFLELDIEVSLKGQRAGREDLEFVAAHQCAHAGIVREALFQFASKGDERVGRSPVDVHSGRGQPGVEVAQGFDGCHRRVFANRLERGVHRTRELGRTWQETSGPKQEHRGGVAVAAEHRLDQPIRGARLEAIGRNNSAIASSQAVSAS